MTRIVTIQVLLFLLPFAVYAGWWMARHWNPDEGVNFGFGAVFTSVRSRWLAGAGAAIVFVFMMFLAFTGGHSPDATYVAPHMEDGVLVPGHFYEPDQEDNAASEEEPQP